MDAGAESRAQVRGASQHVAQVFVPHVLVTVFLHQRLNLEKDRGHVVYCCAKFYVPSQNPFKNPSVLSSSLHDPTYLDQTIAESLKDFPNVSRLLHRDDAEVIFLVDPNQEILFVVVPNTATVGPVTCHA